MMKSPTATIALLAIALGLGCSGTPDDSETTADAQDEALSAGTGLILEYPTHYACELFINYPKDGVVANASWKLTGSRVSWRYNVNETWALVSDPKRAGVSYPWWGFTRRDCIEGEPEQILSGRSHVAASGWRPVQLHLGAAPVVASHKALHMNATLRDPANFVIGNVPDSWHVDVTGVTRSSGHWTLVYVPNAARWGYIEAESLK